ncbi:hypothetical protein BF29_2907 [Heyndrickxia coagulans DSM 1 = ATCC 7050]|nr:hypothetical protein BF29_2907 [Heyndrickxia coagulans DSM 1 = ATCC 7050]
MGDCDLHNGAENKWGQFRFQTNFIHLNFLESERPEKAAIYFAWKINRLLRKLIGLITFSVCKGPVF